MVAGLSYRQRDYRNPTRSRLACCDLPRPLRTGAIVRLALADSMRIHLIKAPSRFPSLRLAMFRFQQATGPIEQVSQLALEPEHSALPFADFA
jgi:hypothetical protein